MRELGLSSLAPKDSDLQVAGSYFALYGGLQVLESPWILVSPGSVGFMYTFF